MGKANFEIETKTFGKKGQGTSPMDVKRLDISAPLLLLLLPLLPQQDDCMTDLNINRTRVT